ncbi:MAG: prephenate dehydrogenase/arogenate dehydrogenase family protein [Microthrixaceae bacterium]
MSTTPEPGQGAPRRAALVGTGLIGGSVGLGLRSLGWHVTGTDEDGLVLARAVELGAVDATGVDPAAELTVVATPVSAVAQLARQALERGGVVTDVGSVKAPVVEAVANPRFVGDIPWPVRRHWGSTGRGDLFGGATWALTPDDHTDPGALSLVHGVVRSSVRRW